MKRVHANLGFLLMLGLAGAVQAADDARAFVSFYDQFVGIVDANQDDCPAMARTRG